VRFKRHPAMLRVLDALLELRTKEIFARLDQALNARGQLARSLQALPGPSLLQRLQQAQSLAQPLGPESRRRLLELLQEEQRRVFKLGAERARLFGDASLLQLAVESDPGELTPAMMKAVLERTARQLQPRAERAHRHVDKDRLATLDGRSLDADTPEDLAESLDVEELPILLELLRRKTGRLAGKGGPLPPLAHLVADEAQENTPLELSIPARALARQGAATIAGDELQQIDAGTAFSSWDDLLRGFESAPRVIRLSTAYRSTRPIMAFARAVLGPLAPAAPPNTLRDGVPVRFSACPNAGHRALELIQALDALLAAEPRARIAIIASSDREADVVFDGIGGQLPARRVREGEFTFKPGLDVTDVLQVKGLEFDYVIIPDASRSAYPDSPARRRMLHVAATRAIHQLWVLWVGQPSPLLPETATT
jgi:DNA helicase-2/ATP-dependent DNA helicase PcrA